MIPQQLLWPGVVVIVVIAIFLTAALTGPLIHANMQEDISDPPPVSETPRPPASDPAAKTEKNSPR